MAVPASKVQSTPGVVLHLRGGATAPSPPPCWHNRPAAYVVALRRHVAPGDAAVQYPDLYYLPSDVGASHHLTPGWYATLEPGDQFTVTVTPNGAGSVDRAAVYRSLPPAHDRVGTRLTVDGVPVSCVDLGVRGQAARRSAHFDGWLGPVVYGRRTFRRFLVAPPKTSEGGGPAGGEGRDSPPGEASPAVGSVIVQWLATRLMPGLSAAGAGAAPPEMPTLSEKDAVKNRSLATGAGSQTSSSFDPNRQARAYGAPLPGQEVIIHYRERRVLVARGVLLEDGEVVPSLRAPAAAATAAAAPGASAAAPASEPGPAAAAVPGGDLPSGASASSPAGGPAAAGAAGSSSPLGATPKAEVTPKAESQPLSGAATAVPPAEPPLPVTPKAEKRVAAGPAGGGAGGGPSKRKAVDVIIID